jgi:hypothetical protein
MTVGRAVVSLVPHINKTGRSDRRQDELLLVPLFGCPIEVQRAVHAFAQNLIIIVDLLMDIKFGRSRGTPY